MYAVIHGGIDPILREKSCRFLSSLAFDGYAIGGSLGKTKEEMLTMLAALSPLLPPEKPNHLLGIGDLPSLAACIPLGLDTFDSSYPTRAARHGMALTSTGSLNITKGEYATAFSPLVQNCSCFTCKNYSRAYLNHLFKAKEIAALTLMSIHNIHFMVELMKTYREKILGGEI